MSNLQVYARRCPVMGKALALQSTRSANASLGGVYGGTRAYHGKARLHTTRPRDAQAVDVNIIRDEPGMTSRSANLVRDGY